MTDPTQQPWWAMLTPAMQQVVAGMARKALAPLHTLGVQRAREIYRQGAQVLEADLPPQAVHRVDGTLAARDGAQLPVRIYKPALSDRLSSTEQDALLPAVLYLHGGGFTIGGIDTHDVLCARMALLAGVAVVSLAYRLAPEQRFPTAVHDVWDAFTFLRRHGADWQLNGDQLAVAGDSAGGTLAAVLALQARDAGQPLAGQCLIYPGTTAHQDTPSHRRFASGPVLNEATITWFFDNYIDRHHREDWRFAPLLAPELDGVAPALVVLAECDPLVDEGIAYADRLRMAGVPVTLELFRGVSHEFLKMGRALPEALAAHHAIADFLRQALRGA
ncbi:alpha/beta hydrolase [Lampropedia cohaerens]|uniref:Alpha/beta hydrolase n=1 Tax=Lampropedia cohaerens TaxID=1610491 RepID=A0A0U1Q262_9BURK|nr:alpha/beta hydrolase [Lampropedia cohaerens]KKW68846.1 alpha/beta hydrolase [Lampropedia cohaerens]